MQEKREHFDWIWDPRSWLIALLLAYLVYELSLFVGYRPEECEKGGNACYALKDHVALLLYPFVWIMDRIDAHHDVLIAVGGLLVAWFTFTLRRSTDHLWEETKKGGVTTERLAAAAEAQSSVSAQLATAAGQQVAIQAAQTDIQKKQHAIGRLQFLAQHRPRLKVRHVQLRMSDNKIYGAGDKAEGGLVVVNAGTTKATIIDSRFLILICDDGLPVEAPDFSNAPELLVRDHVMDIGESCAVPITNIFDREFNTAVPSHVIYVIGQIRYEDEGGVQRFMGFGRRRTSDGRFRPIDDPDYEYED